MRVLRGFREFFVGIAWVLGALSFSALSLGIIIGLAFLLRYALPFLPKWFGGFVFLLAFLIYAGIVGWVALRILRRRLRY